MPQTFYYQFDNSAFHWSFLHRIEFSYEHSVLTNGGNFGATCSVLSTGPLSNVNFFLLLSVVTSFTRETPIVVLSVGCC